MKKLLINILWFCIVKLNGDKKLAIKSSTTPQLTDFRTPEQIALYNQYRKNSWFRVHHVRMKAGKNLKYVSNVLLGKIPSDPYIWQVAQEVYDQINSKRK